MSNSKPSRKFVNPLLQPTTSGIPEQLPPALEGEGLQQQGPSATTFEANHTRMTSWVDRGLKDSFERLCRQKGKGSKTRLLNEALSDLLRKYKAK